MTHLVYSHHHADHIGASSLFGTGVVRIGQVQAKQLLAGENDQARPVPDVTFETNYMLNVGGSVLTSPGTAPTTRQTTVTSTFPTTTL